jgi:uncharacterized membrane protein YhdT
VGLGTRRWSQARDSGAWAFGIVLVLVIVSMVSSIGPLEGRLTW